MSLSKSKCLYSNNCLQFFKRVVPLKTNGLYYKHITMGVSDVTIRGLYCKHDYNCNLQSLEPSIMPL